MEARPARTDQPPQRIVSGRAFDEDARLDASVRPKTMADFIGQQRVKENVQIAVEAAPAAATRSITCCSMARRVWARLRSHKLSPMTWA